MKILIEVDVRDVDLDHSEALVDKLCENIVNTCDEDFTVNDDNYCDCPSCSGHDEEVSLYVNTAVPVTPRELRAREERENLIGSSVL